MKESKLYLRFLKENILYLLIPALFFAGIGYFYQSSQSALYKTSELYQVEYSLENVSEKIALADEAVSQIRSANLGGSLSISSGVNLTAFKPSPLSVSIEVSSSQTKDLESDLDKATNYLTKNFSVKEIGTQTYQMVYPNIWIGVTGGLALGLFLGLLLSLILNYFKSF